VKKSILIIFSLYAFNSYGQQALAKQGINIDSLFKSEQNIAIGKSFPLFTVYYHDKKYTNRNLLGKTIFINFWYTACAPCMAELSELNKLNDTLKSNKKFEFLSFTFDSPRVIRKIMKRFKIRYKIFSLEMKEFNRLSMYQFFPTSIIVGSDGKILFFKIGGSLNKEEVMNTIFLEYYPKILNAL
jgi:thiol-disulfide isomerase/thioredoxin